MSNVGKKESIPMQNTHDLLVGTLSIVIQRVALFDPDTFRIVTRFIAYANFFSWNFTTKDETCEVHFQEGDYELNLECLFAI